MTYFPNMFACRTSLHLNCHVKKRQLGAMDIVYDQRDRGDLSLDSRKDRVHWDFVGTNQRTHSPIASEALFPRIGGCDFRDAVLPDSKLNASRFRNAPDSLSLSQGFGLNRRARSKVGRSRKTFCPPEIDAAADAWIAAPLERISAKLRINLPTTILVTGRLPDYGDSWQLARVSAAAVWRHAHILLRERNVPGLSDTEVPKSAFPNKRLRLRISFTDFDGLECLH